MQEKFAQLKKEFDSAVASLKHSVDLEHLRVDFLGRKGHLALLMKELKDATEEERRDFGKAANEVKEAMEKAFAKKQTEFSAAEEATRAEAEWVDLTRPGVWPAEGHLHPVSQAIAEITDIFSRIGFVRMSAPEVEWDRYAFEMLNMPKDHPARDDWETFFIDAPEGKMGKLVLTPHTSNSQGRVLEEGDLPIRMININRCYRRQSDVTHSPMFHQFEGFVVDQGISIANLKGVLEYFVREFFGPERRVRLRPHHFRFTEPSFEIDISCDACGAKPGAVCRVCKGGWLELGGAGLTHPNVLKAGGVDPKKYTALAFGWGIERCLMMREGMNIADIRLLYRDDLRFVKQF